MKKQIKIDTISKANIFKIPAKYFEKLPPRIWQEINEEQTESPQINITKENIFTIPDDYFETLSQKIQHKIAAESNQQHQNSRILRPLNYGIAIAASFILLIVSLGVWNNYQFVEPQKQANKFSNKIFSNPKNVASDNFIAQDNHKSTNKEVKKDVKNLQNQEVIKPQINQQLVQSDEPNAPATLETITNEEVLAFLEEEGYTNQQNIIEESLQQAILDEISFTELNKILLEGLIKNEGE